jgi:periplasmic divalent cation tolerance protein
MRILLVTAPTDAADRIARTLVEERLAACVNCVDAVRSVYRWNDAIETADEVQLFVKTSDSLVPALAKRIAELHPYAVPEIVALEPEWTLQAYAKWVRDQTKRPSKGARRS